MHPLSWSQRIFALTKPLRVPAESRTRVCRSFLTVMYERVQIIGGGGIWHPHNVVKRPSTSRFVSDNIHESPSYPIPVGVREVIRGYLGSPRQDLSLHPTWVLSHGGQGHFRERVIVRSCFLVGFLRGLPTSLGSRTVHPDQHRSRFGHISITNESIPDGPPHFYHVYLIPYGTMVCSPGAIRTHTVRVQSSTS